MISFFLRWNRRAARLQAGEQVLLAGLAVRPRVGPVPLGAHARRGSGRAALLLHGCRGLCSILLLYFTVDVEIVNSILLVIGINTICGTLLVTKAFLCNLWLCFN